MTAFVRMRMLVVGGLLAVGIVLSYSTAQAASIVGTLDLVGSVKFEAGAQVVDDEVIDFLPLGTGTGGFLTVEEASGYFTGLASTLPGGPFYTGITIDLTDNPALAGVPGPAFAPPGVPISVPGFLDSFTAPGFGTLEFELKFIPLATGAVCDGTEAVGESCIAPGSPFTLTRTAEGTRILFDVRGIFTAFGGADTGAATGAYSATVAGLTPIQVLAAVAAGTDIGPLGFDAQYISTAVPEPVTLLLFGTGLLGVGVTARRRRMVR